MNMTDGSQVVVFGSTSDIVLQSYGWDNKNQDTKRSEITLIHQALSSSPHHRRLYHQLWFHFYLSLS